MTWCFSLAVSRPYLACISDSLTIIELHWQLFWFHVFELFLSPEDLIVSIFSRHEVFVTVFLKEFLCFSSSFFSLKSLLWDVRSCCVPRCECSALLITGFSRCAASPWWYCLYHRSLSSAQPQYLLPPLIITLYVFINNFPSDHQISFLWWFFLHIECTYSGCWKNHFSCHNLLLYLFCCCCEPASSYVTLAGLELTVYHRLVWKSLPFCLGPLITVAFILCWMQLQI